MRKESHDKKWLAQRLWNDDVNRWIDGLNSVRLDYDEDSKSQISGLKKSSKVEDRLLNSGYNTECKIQ